MRTTTQLIIFCVAVLVAPLTARQERVTTGPPPELRALVDAVTGAVLGGSPDAWESMARERFAPALLAKQTVAERRRIFDKLSVAFAGAKRGPVMRQGPDAPLELRMVGPSGPAGAIVLELTSGIPPRISGISIETAATPRPSDPEAPPPPPISPGMTKAQLTAALDAYLRHLSDEGRLSGVALVARDTEVWFEGAYGLAVRGERTSKPTTTQFKVGAINKAFTQTVVEQGSDIANTVATRFNIGSINKAFTRMAIEQLVAQKKLSRSETLGALILDYPQPVSRAATIDQLLNHTAGIADFFGPVFNETPKGRFRSNEDYFRFVSQLPPTFAPGARNQDLQRLLHRARCDRRADCEGAVRTLRDRARVRTCRDEADGLFPRRRERTQRGDGLHDAWGRRRSAQQRPDAWGCRERGWRQLFHRPRSPRVCRGATRRAFAGRWHDADRGWRARHERDPVARRRVDGRRPDKPRSALRRADGRGDHACSRTGPVALPLDDVMSFECK